MLQDPAPFSTPQLFQVGSNHNGRSYWKNANLTDRSLFLICILFLITNLIFWVGFSLPWRVQAQVEDTLIVLPPDVTRFPILSTQIKPKQMPGTEGMLLRKENLSVLEDGNGVEIIDFEKHRAGVHFSLVINGDRLLDLHDAAGETPYDRIQLVFESWVQKHRFSSGETLTLITQEGPLVRNSHESDSWLQALKNYQPNFRSMVPDLTSLEMALKLAEERVVPFGVDKVLLYITPPPKPEEIGPLYALAESARAAEIQVHVWMFGEEFFLYNDQGKALINLAESTGGELFHYNGGDPFPNPENYFENSGVYYDLTFKSNLRQEGTYSLVVESADKELYGESSGFYINVQPPKPILLSPPSSVTRSAPQEWDGSVEGLEPSSLSIEFLLEFPDGHPRDLNFSRLYVDGNIVDERAQEPFDSLKWNLMTIEEPGEHLIQVRVEDTLGLSGETILTPIRVGLDLPDPDARLTIQRVGLIVFWAILVAAGLVLIVWGIRYFLGSAYVQKIFQKTLEFQQTAPVQETTTREHQGKPLANLIPLSAGIFDWKQLALKITKRETTIGSDPAHANLILESEDVEGLHARLLVENDIFWLSDCDSKSGSWVNYDPISSQPVQLHPGDIIHFGATGFRFTVIDLDSPPSATIEKYEPLS